ncbi:MAG TPA: S8 family peptidase [Pyrinomonadaceae bacterium]|nr:S8 family peptidase [Pyrinomonadaceae bacterium]
MSVSSRALVELVLLGPMNDRRQLQDSPILGDVWVAFAVKPSEPMDLLVTPYRERPAGPVAASIARSVRQLQLPRGPGQEAQIAYLQGLVAARLFFEEVFRVIVPMTHWWGNRDVHGSLNSYFDAAGLLKDDLLRNRIKTVIDWAQAANEDERIKLAEKFADFRSLDRFVILATLILWADEENKKAQSTTGTIADALAKVQGVGDILPTFYRMFRTLLQARPKSDKGESANVWHVSLNRRPMLAVERSVPSVKGDAARTLFNVRCNDIRWAVLDSGIDATHEAFLGDDNKSRVIKAYDFSNIRKIVSLDNPDKGAHGFEQRVAELREGREDKLSQEDAADILVRVAEDAEKERPLQWELVEQFLEIDPLKTPPVKDHGTHVAGIIGARKPPASTSYFDGLCPDIKLYDFRVLSATVEDTEFAIIAALQYIRYLNERHTFMSVHGANLSLSIPHDVRNYACGRTPICNECERLVGSGVVVVAAAGNLGYQSFETKDGSYEGYAAFSITDPGNADGVITVGATHRYRPHTYGVSYFSSRGPTGDGRLKPDLVAPGERVQSCLLDKGWGELSGTSMAAPHVSGAAAMLMARYSELIGEPRRIKRILCESATDLGRERSFQGNGMLDVLRAFQHI